MDVLKTIEPAYLMAGLTGLIACATDLRTRRIPNPLTFGSIAVALVFHAVSLNGHGVLYSLEGWALGAAIFFIPFALGGMGAGDVKLLAAIGAWIGPLNIVWAALWTGVAGGVLALGVGMYHGYLLQAVANIRLLLMHWRVSGLRPLPEVTLARSRGPRLAYAVPIFVGLVVTAWAR
jgi:prepilin peptidase CpaA